ncbi:holo-ACP synthase [bacterium]|nr:holo-ACP synthase [bacterium]
MVIGVGMDIQEIESVHRAIERGQERFLEKTFTPGERTYCREKKNAAQHFAGRFCAKEAFFKALGTGWGQGVRWTDVEVVREENGQPRLRLFGRAAELSEQAGVKKSWLSLSHSRAYAAATVVLEG